MKKYIFYFIATLLVSISAFSQVTPTSKGITGTGTDGYIAKFTGAKKIGNSSLIDLGNNLTSSKTGVLNFSFGTASNTAEIYLASNEALFYNKYGGFYCSEGLPSGDKYFQILNSNSVLKHGTQINFDSPKLYFPQLTASSVPILNASKELVSSSTTTTQLSYLDATSSVQTQLNGKLSSTTERLLTICGFNSINPADGLTYYFGEYYPNVATTTQSTYKFQFANTITVTKVLITVRQVVNPTSESVSFYLRASGTTDQTITTSMDMSTIGANTNKTFVYSGLNLTGTAGTDYELKMLCPTWATNPTNTQIVVKIFGY